MTTQQEHVRNLTVHIIETAPLHDMKTGQYLFNLLRGEIAVRVRGSLHDPFHKEWDYDQIFTWLDNHIVFDDDGNMIGYFDDNMILWEKKNG